MYTGGYFVRGHSVVTDYVTTSNKLVTFGGRSGIFTINFHDEVPPARPILICKILPVIAMRVNTENARGSISC